MNNTVKMVLTFLGGALIGGATGFLVTRAVMRKKCDEEVNSVIEEFTKYKTPEPVKEKENIPEPEPEKEPEKEVPEMKKEEYDKLVNAYHEAKDEPFLIDMDDYGADGYDERVLFIYQDGTMIEEHADIPLSNKEVNDIIGLDNLTELSKDGIDDRIYVRNPKSIADYEVIYMDKEYVGDSP